MSKSLYSFKKMVPMIAVIGAIFFLSHMRGDEISLPAFAYSDLVAHMLIYGLLGATILYAWDDRKKNYPLKVILYTVMTCLLYGISDEFHQSFIPGRYVSGMDVLADTIGSTLVCGLWWFSSKQ